VASAFGGETTCTRYMFPGSRDDVRGRAAQAALFQLWRLLEGVSPRLGWQSPWGATLPFPKVRSYLPTRDPHGPRAPAPPATFGSIARSGRPDLGGAVRGHHGTDVYRISQCRRGGTG